MTYRPSRAELLERLYPIIVEQSGINPDQILPDSRLLEDLGIDSLGLVEVIIAVEEEFQIRVPEGDDITDPALAYVFTKPGFSVRDLADLIYMLWDSSDRSESVPFWQCWRKTPQAPTANAAFTQLDATYVPCPDLPLVEALEPNEEGYPTEQRRTDGMVCIHLPADSVQMENERIEVQSFSIDVEPVSTTAYARFLNSIGPLDPETEELWFALPDWDKRQTHLPLGRTIHTWRPHPGVETWPMMLVSWYGANAYALWANGADWQGYRETSPYLPTNAQFIYAARGSEPRVFPWGDAPATPELANVEQHFPRRSYALEELPLSPVHTFLGLSPFGLRHMAGNVWQWTQDWYDDAQQVRCERGGSWIGSADLARCDYGRGRPPHAKGRCLGFRCVRPLDC